MRLHSEIARALKSNDVRQPLLTEGLETKSNSPEEMGAFVKAELDRWGKVVRASGAKAD